MASSGILAGVGDLLSQYLEGKNKSFDSQRTKKFFLTGIFFVGPFLYTHYTYVLPALDFTFIPLSSALRKVIVDQTYGSCAYFFSFYSFVNFFEGRSFEETKDQLRSKLWPTLLTNWKVWPFINFVNFQYIPISYQVLFNNFFSLFFNAYLSYMHHLPKDKLI